MGVVACQDCGGKVSERAEACPHCGALVGNFAAESVPSSLSGWRIAEVAVGTAIGVMIAMLVLVWMGKTFVDQRMSAMARPGGTGAAVLRMPAAVARPLAVNSPRAVEAVAPAASHVVPPDFGAVGHDMPQEVERAVRARVVEQWPDNYVMQETILKQERESYREVMDFAPADVPADVLAGIKRKAVNDWKEQYFMQWAVVKQETDSYRSLHR